MVAEDDIRWLVNEIERYNRRPPWYNDPDPFDPVDPIFRRDDVVYLAYRGAKRRAIGTTRFGGQAELRKKVEELDNAPPSHKEAVATKVSEIITAERREEVATWADERGRKKRPRNMSTTPSLSSDGVTITTTPTNNSPRIPSRNITATILTGILPPRYRAHIATPTLDAPHKPPCHSFEGLSISKAENILPDHLFSMVDKLYSAEREPYSVCVGMEYRNTDDGTLTLRVSSNHIDYIAMRLFGIQLLSNNKNRYFRISRANIVPGLIQNCAVDSILEFFGEPLTKAIQASATYELDRINKSNTTQAVTLRLSTDHMNDPGILILHIGLYPFTNIWKTLCPANQSPPENSSSDIVPPLGVAMPFTLRPLDPNIIFDNAQSTPCWVVGKNQHIYWRRCFLRAYTSSKKHFTQASCETCDGQCIVPEGRELFLGGRGGYVKVQE